jgi:F-type H+-transporting ATPase subunit epsilon
MAHDRFRVEVLTPEGGIFDEEVEQVSTRTQVGSLGILARHQPLLGLLEPTELRLYRTQSDVVRFAQGEGYVQVTRDGVLLLVEEAHPPEQLDRADLEAKLRDAEQEARDAEQDSEAQRRAQRDARRWRAFLDVAAGDAR